MTDGERDEKPDSPDSQRSLPAGPLRRFVPNSGHNLLAAALAVLAIAFLQVMLAVFYWIPDPRLRFVLGPVWDVVGVVLLLVGWAKFAPQRRWAERTLMIVLTTLLFLFFMLGIAQGFARREFGYDVVLRLHLPYVPALFRMLYRGEPFTHFILYLVLLAAIVLFMIAAIYVSLNYLRLYVANKRRRQVGVAAGALAYLIVGGIAAGAHGPLLGQAYKQVDLALHLHERLGATARKMELESTKTRRTNPFVGAAHKPDIYLFVVESYGQALLDPHKYTGFDKFLEMEQGQLAQAGYYTASKYLRTPTFGGSSWMADSTLLCGVRIDDQSRYESIYQTHIKCLDQSLHDAGYHTVMAAANTTQLTKRMRRKFPFDAYYFKGDFHYQGPRFAWSYMPDQFVIDYVDRHEVSKRWNRRQPLFMYYILTSSHHPWTTIPRFIAWNKIGNGSIYNKVAPVRFSNAFVSGSQYKIGFRTSIQYSLKTITAYLDKLPANRDAIAFILGDHQVRRPIANMRRDPWWVPIHIVSRDRKALARFAKFGYKQGMVPQQPPHGKADVSWHFTEELLSAYGGH